MRIGYGLSLAALSLLCCSNAFAAFDNDEKPWTYDLGSFRAVIPEVEPNNTCATAQPVGRG